MFADYHKRSRKGGFTYNFRSVQSFLVNPPVQKSEVKKCDSLQFIVHYIRENKNANEYLAKEKPIY
ncbi:hypothetical protein DSM107010_14560 [Chroococcidiopsis cubana SAG 39.79]|uniref:Uncharacterized protein n=1 Tax=Chroococcidiopsis cubana SAG 39.79 TaxID=388085 RepID=A0AB37UP28_9CYAN|nr:hypothetical protein DSM107010_14560 [Chroococcidiopsis cubana SAG 39.79]